MGRRNRTDAGAVRGCAHRRCGPHLPRRPAARQAIPAVRPRCAGDERARSGRMDTGAGNRAAGGSDLRVVGLHVAPGRNRIRNALAARSHRRGNYAAHARSGVRQCARVRQRTRRARQHRGHRWSCLDHERGVRDHGPGAHPAGRQAVARARVAEQPGDRAARADVPGRSDGGRRCREGCRAGRATGARRHARGGATQVHAGPEREDRNALAARAGHLAGRAGGPGVGRHGRRGHLQPPERKDRCAACGRRCAVGGRQHVARGGRRRDRRRSGRCRHGVVDPRRCRGAAGGRRHRHRGIGRGVHGGGAGCRCGGGEVRQVRRFVSAHELARG